MNYFNTMICQVTDSQLSFNTLNALVCENNDSHTTLVKVDVPNLVTYLNQTPILELHVVRCGSEIGYQKDICSKE
jgi:hypothetical protein